MKRLAPWIVGFAALVAGWWWWPHYQIAAVPGGVFLLNQRTGQVTFMTRIPNNPERDWGPTHVQATDYSVPPK
jgi:hypothetical protein